MSPVREFARYLIRNGSPAYVIPVDLTKKKSRPVPYIYSKDEILAVWEAHDTLNPSPNSPARHLVLPAMIRILYCCGLRPAEAMKLKVSDVNLDVGRLFIREAKGHKDRIVMMSTDVNDYMCTYSEKVEHIFPGRDYFFPGTDGGICAPGWHNANWEIIRKRVGLYAVCGKRPRLYDFRHTFATHRLYEWMHEGKDLHTVLPYLSAYMGHAQLSDTYYYIHLVPGQFETLSGIDFKRYEDLLPEVECDE